MANFPTKATGSQLVTSNHQVLEYVPTHNISTGTTTVYYDEKNTVMLLDGDYGRDKSYYARGLTQNGSSTPYRKRGYYFNSGDAISFSSSDFNFGTEDFTIELWMKTEWSSYDTYARRIFLLDGPSGNNSSENFQLAFHNTGKIWLWAHDGSSATIDQIGNTVVTDNKWHHVAVTRESGTIKLWIDGVLDTSTTYASSLGNVNGGSPRPQFGRYTSTQGRFIGNMSDIHISKGVARYTASFDEAATNINYTGSPKDSNHKLILRGGDDESDSGHSLTFGGNAHKTVPTTGHQASFYFDGSGDYFTFPESDDFDLSSSSFTIEAWVNFSTIGDYIYFINKSHPSNGFELGIANDNKFILYSGNNGWLPEVKSNSAISANQWYHLAVTYNGSVYKMYVDGVEQSDTTTSSTYPAYSTSYLLTVGALREGTNGTDFHGYLADVRLSKGVVRYTSGFSTPTAPLEKEDLATKFLLNPDATVHDYNVKRANDSFPTYYGDSKSVRRGYSFDGNGDYISTSQSSDFTFDGDFTVEFWVKKTADGVGSGGQSGYDVVIGCNQNGGNNGGGWFLEWSDQRGFLFADSDGNNVAVMTWDYDPVGKGWEHVAFTREGTTCRLFVNGKLKSSVTYSASITCSNALYVGGTVNIGTTNFQAWPFNGNLADIRISKGIARYTADFTTPVTTKDSYHKFILDGDTTDSSDSSHSLTFGGQAHTTAKFGDGSYYFDGSGDYISVLNSDLVLDGEFTIEMWVYNQESSSDALFFNSDKSQSYPSYPDFYFGAGNNGGNWRIRILGTDVSSGIGAVPVREWFHVAVTRDSSNLVTLWQNGTAIHTISNKSGDVTLVGGEAVIGTWLSSQYHHTGYIDDFRVSNVARYTDSFDVPTAALPITSSSQQETTTDSSVLVLRPVAGSTFHESDRASTHDKTLFHLSPLDSTSLEDLSPYNMTVSTSHGDPTVDVNSTVSGSAAIVFDGNDALSVSDHINFDLRDEDFTIETWVKFSTVAADNTLWSLHGQTLSQRSMYMQRTAAGNLMAYYYYGAGSNAYLLNDAWSVSADTWYHVAMCREGANLRVFVNGTQFGSTYNIGTNYIQDCGYPLRLGAVENTGGTVTGFLNGSLADFVVTKSAKYTEAFTPPSRQSRIDAGMPSINSLSDFHAGNAITFHAGSSEPSTPTSGSYVLYADTPDDDKTELLLHFDGDNAGTVSRDSSGNNHFLTFNGQTNTSNTKSKFGATSAYFDGDGDYVDISATSNFNFGTDDFTIEFWMNTYETGADPQGMYRRLWMFDGPTANTPSSNNLQIVINYFHNSGVIHVQSGPDDLFYCSTRVTDGEWHHVAVVRESNQFKVYVDGSLETMTGTTSYTSNIGSSLNSGSPRPRIGSYNSTQGNYSGYIDEVRVSKGVARYTTSFTPPTQPFGGGLRMKAPDGKVYALSLSGSI